MSAHKGGTSETSQWVTQWPLAPAPFRPQRLVIPTWIPRPVHWLIAPACVVALQVLVYPAPWGIALQGVVVGLLDALVAGLTLAGDSQNLQPIIDELLAFRRAGVTDLGLRLYGNPEAAIRLVAERVVPAIV